MAERRFNPFDPLGLFQRRENPPETSTEPDFLRQRSAQARQENVNKFLADIRQQLHDEQHAFNEYTRLANEADRLGFTQEARTLLQMSTEAGKHRRDLETLTLTVR